MVGLERSVVKLAAYSPGWKRLFEEERALLEAALGDYVLDIQHVGSTSIPGMPAKPIIDIGIAVENFERAAVCVPLMERLGYVYRGEHRIPRRHYFVKGDPRTHHVHMVEEDSRVWGTMVLFRDHLIRNPELAQQYAELKQQLAEEYSHTDRQAYQDGKAPFIEWVLREAGLT